MATKENSGLPEEGPQGIKFKAPDYSGIIGANRSMRNANQQHVFELLEKDTTRNGGESVANITSNFLTVFRYDDAFAEFRFNELAACPEKKAGEAWTSADDAWSRGYIEATYDLYSMQKWQDAFCQFQQARKYHPVRNHLSAISWDGQNRCEDFLRRWLKADDTPYTREVSRLIFAGAINRIYNPGCKFDCVPVLMGPQGSGKSTICHWLALQDRYYNSISTIQGQRGSEGILGVWICEIEELLAVLSSAKESSASVESAKAFISKQDEYYRQPYTKRAEHNPRQCIFIGTTNRDTFVTDPTGARRWFPVRVKSNARDLYDHEAECREYILQAYAEMRDAYERGLPLASLAPSPILSEQIKEQQESIMSDDWRIGVIGKYVEDKHRVCILQIWTEALAPIQGRGKMARKDSNEIAEVLVHQLHWERHNVESFGDYGRQKAFHAPKTDFSAS